MNQTEKLKHEEFVSDQKQDKDEKKQKFQFKSLKKFERRQKYNILQREAMSFKLLNFCEVKSLPVSRQPSQS